MNPYYTAPGISIYHGSSLDVLCSLPENSVHCVVTSPPYWGLRDYGTAPQTWGGDPECAHEWQTERYYTENTAGRSSIDAFSEPGQDNAERLKLGRWRQDDTCAKCGAWRGSLGLEPTPDMFVTHLVAIFREVRRVLRTDGTLWVNMGDSYANDGKWGGETGGKQSYLPDADRKRVGREKRFTGLKQKDLVGIPWMLAFALRADGWYLRSEIIWAKPNPMPESVTDRPTKSHEQIFLLSKSPRYFYDAEAIRQPVTNASLARLGQDIERQEGSHRANGGAKTNGTMKAVRFGGNKAEGYGTRIHSGKEWKPTDAGSGGGLLGHSGNTRADGRVAITANRKTVWTIATQPYKEAHFATFPPKLVQPCILAGTSARGVCPECGAPWQRVMERTTVPPASWKGSKFDDGKNLQVHPDVGKRNGKMQQLDEDGTHHGQNGRRVERGTFSNDKKSRPGSPETSGWRPTCDHAAEPVPATVMDIFHGSGTTGMVAQHLGRHYIGIELKEEYIKLSLKRVRQLGMQL